MVVVDVSIFCNRESLYPPTYFWAKKYRILMVVLGLKIKEFLGEKACTFGNFTCTNQGESCTNAKNPVQMVEILYKTSDFCTGVVVK